MMRRVRVAKLCLILGVLFTIVTVASYWVGIRLLCSTMTPVGPNMCMCGVDHVLEIAGGEVFWGWPSPSSPGALTDWDFECVCLVQQEAQPSSLGGWAERDWQFCDRRRVLTRRLKPPHAPLWIFPVPLFVLFLIFVQKKYGYCRRCGYDLRENISGVCPECGTSIKNDSDRLVCRVAVLRGPATLASKLMRHNRKARTCLLLCALSAILSVASYWAGIRLTRTCSVPYLSPLSEPGESVLEIKDGGVYWNQPPCKPRGSEARWELEWRSAETLNEWPSIGPLEDGYRCEEHTRYDWILPIRYPLLPIWVVSVCFLVLFLIFGRKKFEHCRLCGRTFVADGAGECPECGAGVENKRITHA